MGITGLLPFLKSIQRDVHVSSMKGLKVGIDAYCWLHKGAYSCATQIVMKTADIQTLPFINYCLRRVNLLRQHGITPIVVFDGGYLPTKANTEKDRRQKRQSYLLKGKEMLKQGKKSEAHDCFQKSVDISPEMALVFIKECRKLNVQCIVAPYEADSQLAYLSKEGLVDVIITEDSDLLVFGAKKVLYKMDEFGNGKLIEMKDLGKANTNLIGFTEDSFRHMCILSGCDYLPSVPGIGLGKSAKLMRKHNQNPTQVIRALRCENSKVPSDYDINFKKAEYTFLYQLVFDPRTQQQVRLNELPEGIDPKEFEFAGIEHSPKKAIHMARGNINPITMEVMDVYSPSKVPPSTRSQEHKPTSWSCSVMGSANKQYPMAIQAKLPITSSARLSRPFKPPAKAKSPTVQKSDGVLRNEQLMNLYADGGGGYTATPKHALASDTSKTFSLSRFFDDVKDGHTEVTPDETDGDQLQLCARKLLDTEEHDNSLDIDSTPCVTSGQTGSAKKRLFPSVSSKLSKFMYSGAKRRRSEVQEAGEDESKPSVRKNPFSMSRQTQSQSHSPVCEPHNYSPDQCEAGLTSPVTMTSTPDPVSPASTPDPAVSPFTMASTPDPVSPDPVIVVSSYDPTPSVSFSNSHSLTSVSPIKNRSWSGAGDHRRRSLPNPVSLSKRKQATRRVGLSKKVKPARLSEPGLGQSQLSTYSFVRKPQMKL